MAAASVPSARPIRDSIAFAVAYLAAFALLDWLSYIRPFHALNITPWNPQTALAIAVLLWNRRWVWLVWLSLVAAELAVRGAPSNWAITLAANAALALSYAAIARAARRRLDRSPVLATRRDVAWLAVLCGGGALLSATVYVATFALVQLGLGASLLEALLRYWVGDAVGLIVVLPVALMAMDSRRRAELAAVLRRSDTWLVAVATALLVVFIFGPDQREQLRFFYLLFAPVVWASARLGLPGAVLAVAWTQAGLLVGAQAVLHADLAVFEVQALLVAIAMTGLVVGVAVDERERAVHELKGTLRLAAAGEMAAALAHEMSQPITALNTYAMAANALLASPGRPDEERLAGLEHIAGRMADDARRAGDVLTRLRDFFRSGHTRLEPVPPARLVNEAVEASSRRAQGLGVSLRAELDGDLPTLLIDPLEIALVLRNLIANGIEATVAARAAGTVVVRAQASEGAIRIEVIDDGPGIATERRHQLFDAAPSDKPGGMGVGLSICRAIVEAHGGRIWAEDAPRGHFALTLPLDGAPRDAS
jgi:signal transduction histidine kinase